MLTNYLKIAWRNLLRNKTFSAINILGLSVGMTCCMLLWLYIRSELSFDKHQEAASELFILGQKVSNGGRSSNSGEEESSHISAPYAFALKSEFPEIEQAGRLWVNLIDEKALLQVREPGKRVQSFYENKGYLVDSTFFDLFTYQFTEGSPRSALTDPNSVVLSEQVARKLFGSKPALDQIIRIGGTTGSGEEFKVTGVFRDESARSHIDARFFVPISSGWVGRFLRSGPLDFANNNMFHTYLKLRPGTDPRQLEKKLPAFVEKYARNDLKTFGVDKKLFLVGVPDIHLYNRFQTVITPTNSTTYLYILGSIALFTLLIACVNFMNLSTAQSAKRAAEVGVRKVMGAEQNSLVWQFLGESMLLTFLALAIAVGLVLIFLPIFNQLTSRSLSGLALLEPQIVLAFLALAALTGLVAGSYPAFYLSWFNPARVLKGKISNSLSAIALRRGLVVFQFVVSVGLVLATFVIEEQMDYMRNKSLGFTQDQQVIVPFRSSEARGTYTAFRNEILRNSQVVSAAGTQYYPGIANASDFMLHLPEQTVEQGQSVKTNWVDFEYLQTMGFQLKQGRGFSRQFPGDTNNRMVVNEATLRKFQIPASKALGQKLTFEWQGTAHQFEIVGVVRDFHYEDLHKTIEPYAFMLNSRPDFNYMVVHVNAANMTGVLNFLEGKWKALSPDEPFEYTFLNEDFRKNFQAEARTSRIVTYFTIISILISCLGLFGLAAFAAQQRTKEIGVRKVLGASVGDIVVLLSKDFLKLVVIALVIASPVAWWAMNRWLQSFAYKIAIEWWMFAGAGLLAVGIALLTVSSQSLKAALMNPVKSLRTE
ncbi:ABC transporter permease [Tellurirhabdus rosea]|uniref:ABC transporter permease n=1 Tax=Tellurirhabdus rosea TaxID=2674997 RepID=UPI002252A389|nr:ABC transporter permease [Tellurirhabdus rosea]